jgi:oligo-1,6-glucosidase
MDNPEVREEVKRIMRFWLDMGVDGFREDVITYISKRPGLPDGLPFLPMINGLPHYKDGPNLIPYLEEFRDVAREYGALQIGEAPLTGVDVAKKYVSGPDRVLDMVITFDHMMADCFLTEYVHHSFSLRKFKKAISKWQYAMEGSGWNALYLENHDHPRIISRYGSHLFWRESGTMLAACYIFLQGCPFIYQGQELGMTNIRLGSIEHYLDVASKNAYNTFHKRESEIKRLRRIHVSSRDSARTPLQWSSEKYAGFSSKRPWFFINRNHKRVNAAAQEKDKNSILNFYRKAIALRKSNKTLIWGTYREHYKKNKHIFMYERIYKSDSVLVICSFSKLIQHYELPESYRDKKLKLLLGNYPTEGRTGWLRPYETQVYTFS